MNTSTKLTVLLSAMFAALFLVVGITVYETYDQNREREFYERLNEQAMTKAKLILDANISPSVVQFIYKQTPFQEEVAIYDTSFRLIYHDAVEIDKVKETKGMIDSIVALKTIHFQQGDHQAIGFLYPNNGVLYVITAAAYDKNGLENLSNLRSILIIAWVLSVFLSIFVSSYWTKRALRPIGTIAAKVEEIGARNLDMRLTDTSDNVEIRRLAMTINQLLERLERSFDSQKQFVSTISHELRTPLTAMIAELELLLAHERPVDEYRTSVVHALTDAEKILHLCNDLLDLARASYDRSEISFHPIRIDELIVEARTELLHLHPDYSVHIVIEQDIENEREITVNGNEYLLRIAFHNLMENGCKYSPDNECTVSLTHYSSNVILRFSDRGLGISEEDIPKIFTPFYRGSNVHHHGTGIGLALTDRILSVHQGSISVLSQLGKGSVFTITLPKL
jgi:signal transduction histidine kinase